MGSDGQMIVMVGKGSRLTNGPGIIRPMVRGLVLAMVSCLVLSSQASARALLSGPSPFSSFANCQTPPASTGQDPPQLGAEVETTAAGDSEGNLYAAWQQDRFPDSGGGGLGIGFARSLDGGRTWENRGGVDGVGCLAPTLFTRASDPWLDVGPDGTVYLAALPLNGDLVGGPNGISFSTSHDQGKTFKTTFVGDMRPDAMADKESLAADPDRAGHAIAVWNRFDSGNDVMGAETYDGGQTWTGPFKVLSSIDAGQYYSPLVVFYDSRPMIIYARDSNSGIIFQSRQRNSDGSWSKAVTIAKGDGMAADGIRSGDTIAAAAAQGSRAALLFVRAGADDRGSKIMLSRIDAKSGKGWRTRKVWRSALNHFFAPAMVFNRRGYLRAAIYGARGKRVTEFSLSPDLNRPRLRAIGSSFAISSLPVSQHGPMIGDYQGLVCPDRCQAIFAAGGSWARDGKSDVWASSFY